MSFSKKAVQSPGHQPCKLTPHHSPWRYLRWCFFFPLRCCHDPRVQFLWQVMFAPAASTHDVHHQLPWSARRSPRRRQQGLMSSRWLPAGTELFALSRTFLPAHKNILKWRKGRARNRILMFIAEKMASLQLGHQFPCECKRAMGAHVFQIPMSFSVGVKPN